MNESRITRAKCEKDRGELVANSRFIFAYEFLTALHGVYGKSLALVHRSVVGKVSLLKEAVVV